jgi:hypothetical protein
VLLQATKDLLLVVVEEELSEAVGFEQSNTAVLRLRFELER